MGPPQLYGPRTVLLLHPRDANTPADFCNCLFLHFTLSLNRTVTCKQSSEVLMMRGDFDWQASSKGRKYLSASMKFAFGGAAVPSLGQKRRVINSSKHACDSKLHFLFY